VPFAHWAVKRASSPANHLLTITHHDCIEDFGQPSGEYYAQVLGNCCSGGWFFARRYADRHGEYRILAATRAATGEL
jgi:hypothetical protein